MRLSYLATAAWLLSKALVIAVLSTAQYAQADGERLNISVVSYSGKDEDFKVFRSRLGDWVLNLSEELSAPAGADYLRRLKLVDRKAEFSTAADLDSYWKTGDALQVLTGSIAPEAGNSYFVQSRIYLGDLQGAFPRKTILIEVPFTARNYADTQDSHTAVLLYGLAMDAERVDSSHKALIAQLLKSAKDKLADIKKRKSLAWNAQSPLPELERAVEEAEKRLKGQQ
jgi:hypothetical protein